MKKTMNVGQKFNELVGDKINIVGDDLFCSNIKLVNEGLEKKWANSLLLKVNQIGTVSEAIESAQAMLKNNKKGYCKSSLR